MKKEMFLEKDNQILHIFIKDEYIDLKHDSKINNINYQNYLDNNFETYKYNSYQELYNFVIEDEIKHDIEDLGLFDENSKWNFYINFEELKKMGYGFMVKEEFPLIKKYVVSKDKINDFFNHFTLEELKDFEETLHLYFETDDINNNKETLELCSKNNNTFNSDIIHLVESLISYEDFIDEYTPQQLSYFDLSFEKIIQYFQENEIKDLMKYGTDDDNGLFNLSDMYKEILNKLDVRYSNIYTKDISDEKYETIISFPNNAKIRIDINAWDGIRKAITIMEKKHKNCRWKFQRPKKNKNYILIEGFYWLVYVYFNNDKKLIDADIDFFEERIKLYKELLKLDHKTLFENDININQLLNYFNKKESTIQKAIIKMLKINSNYKYKTENVKSSKIIQH